MAPDSAREPAPASLVTCSPLNPETLAIIGQNPGHCYGARLLQACHFFPGRNVRALHNSGGARDHQPGSHVAADPPLAFASRLSLHRPRSGTCLCPGEQLPAWVKRRRRRGRTGSPRRWAERSGGDDAHSPRHVPCGRKGSGRNAALLVGVHGYMDMEHPRCSSLASGLARFWEKVMKPRLWIS